MIYLILMSYENTIIYNPIGIIHSPFKEPDKTPIQPVGGTDIEAEVEVFPDYIQGLDDLDGFSHIILLYHFHRSKKFSLKVKPFLDNVIRGLFSTRAPARPNSIGLSIVRLIGINNGIIRIRDIDILDDTPLLDIKPYIPKFDERDNIKTGWMGNRAAKAEAIRADRRFSG